LDASALTHFDSSAWAVILACRRAVMARGAQLRIVGLPERALNVLQEALALYVVRGAEDPSMVFHMAELAAQTEDWKGGLKSLDLLPFVRGVKPEMVGQADLLRARLLQDRTLEWLLEQAELVTPEAAATDGAPEVAESGSGADKDAGEAGA